MKKVFMIIGIVVVALVIAGIILFKIVDITSDKLVCTSDEGNITIMYNDKALTGYKAKNISYDFDGQNDIAKEIGVEEYLEQFKVWFSTNTTGTCK